MTMDRIAQYLILMVGFFIPISTAITNIGFSLLFLIFIFSGDYKERAQIVFQNPIALICLLLFLLLGIGIFYSEASFSDAASVWMKYRKLLWVAVLIPFLQGPKFRRLALYSFFAAMISLLLLSYGHVFRGLSNNAVVFKDHIAQNFLMAFAAYVFLQYGVYTTKKLWRYLAFAGACLMALNVLLFVQGRTGYLVLIALLLLAAYQHFSWRGILLAGGATILFLATFFMVSNTFQNRVLSTFTEVQVYTNKNESSSAGLRLEFYKNTLQIIQKNPWIGQGTGSFAEQYAEFTQGKTGASSIKSTNPHNEYLMFAAQLGIVGLGLFCYLLYELWRQSRHLPCFERSIAQGVLVAFVLGCMLNSFLLNFTEGHWFVYFLAILYAGQFSKGKNTC